MAKIQSDQISKDVDYVSKIYKNPKIIPQNNSQMRTAEKNISTAIRKKSIRKLSCEIKDSIWNSDNFKFKTTKYVLPKLLVIPGMNIQNLKSLLHEKANISPNCCGGLMYIPGKDICSILIRKQTVKDLNLLENKKFSTWSATEVIEVKEVLKNVFKINTEYSTIKNRPLSIALSILEKSKMTDDRELLRQP